jgi:hypothetical protein
MEWVPVPESLLVMAMQNQFVVYAAAVGIGLGVWNRWFRQRRLKRHTPPRP